MISINSFTGLAASNNLIGSRSRGNEQDLKSRGSRGLAEYFAWVLVSSDHN